MSCKVIPQVNIFSSGPWVTKSVVQYCQDMASIFHLLISAFGQLLVIVYTSIVIVLYLIILLRISDTDLQLKIV